MLEQLKYFQLTDKPVFCERYGSGHINTTFLVMDASARQYILQKINTNVFRDPYSLMNNIQAIIKHLRLTSKSSRDVMRLVPTLEEQNWLVDENGDYWRMYDFISGSLCLNQVESEEDFHESAVAFGQFQRRLADFDASSLSETIVDFHHTPKRFQALRKAIDEDVCQRAKTVEKEIEFALEREEYSKTLLSLYEAGMIKLRVTHNDTKLNNVLFDRTTRKALCVIDLDTVMPGFAANDFGDSIRFGASTAAEDETELNKVNFSLPLFKSYTEGFLSACGESLMNSEILHLPDGAKMMTLECGIRFLADYLSGDTYFKIHRPAHNLDRCRTQFKLVADMEKNWDAMQKVIKENMP